MTTAKRASDLVGERVKDLRQRHGFTAEQLAQRCADLGAPQISAAVLANIETGRRDKNTGERRRDVTVDELLVLAYALDVPPVMLFVPFDGETRLQITPDEDMSSLDALVWVTGEQRPPRDDRERRARWLATIGPLNLHRNVFRLIRSADGAEGKALEDDLRTLGQMIDLVIENGIAPPELPEEWAKTIRARGWTEYPDEVR